MRLNSETVRSLYASLCCVYPFTKWDLPLPEAVDFVINKDTETMGTYCYTDGEDWEHQITISSARCDHFYTLLIVLCHEVVHLSLYRQKGDKWLHHSKQFRTRCALVARELGLDPKEL